ncbi:efflux RND transporter periplasmic adaptor subunit [Ralstonia insidiosa]|uniref:efflux RND transporter periplasmic adaptor subunit n=1 Tax=Ralstonia TaxID=48736 RepID=UPI00066EF30E|nr:MULTISPECIES: efflux RND transporter periplasmic adaptor subunit [Ralstonia]MBY4707893.1 efflux RND transporter periplasmic adaptor subunit [Ralstonia insidiosa]GAQ28441.1 acriflavin resistance lipoprotein A [Ralstonia sp. NT80]
MRNRSLLCSRRLVAAAALVTVLAACGKDKPVPHASGPVEVGVVTVAAQNLPVAVELPGRVNPVRVAQVRARAAGIVLKKQFVEGSEVKAGQSLFQIDPAPLQATLDSARAAAAKAQATLAQAALQEARYRDLVPINAVSKQDYDNAVIAVKQSEADLASARAAVRTAELNLGNTKVNSPIDGRIGAAQVTEGALVGQGDATLMATVTQLDPIYVDVTQASTQILALRRAMQAGQLQGVDGKAAQVHLVLDDGTVYPLPGTFKFSDITVDQTTGSVSLRAEFPNPNKDLLPGMFVRARLDQATQQNALTVPQAALSRDAAGNATVMIVNAQNKVEARPVKATTAVGSVWVIDSGLTAGDKVIVNGLQKVKPGGDVTTVAADAPATQPATPDAASAPAAQVAAK